MSLPSPDWNGVELTWRGKLLDGKDAEGYLTLVADTADFLDDDPDSPVSVFSVPVSIPIVNGVAKMLVPATDDPDITPTGFTYTLTEELKRGRGRKITFTVPLAMAETGINLNRVFPVGASAGTPATPVSRAEFDSLLSETPRLDLTNVALDEDGVPFFDPGTRFRDATPVFLDADLVPYIPVPGETPMPMAGRGAPGGIAPLDGSARVPEENLPTRLSPTGIAASFVAHGPDVAAFEATLPSGTEYVYFLTDGNGTTLDILTGKKA